MNSYKGSMFLAALLLAAATIGASGCEPAQTPTEEYQKYLAIGQQKSSYYEEPKTHERYPLVQGTLTNLGTKKLSVVEFTIQYKNNLRQVIWEDHAYPVFVSELARADLSQPLEPGQSTKFAFKAPKCPPTWQPGFVDIKITKIAYTKTN